MNTIKRMDIKEFREIGYLQEINRLFLHPLGLALEVVVNEDGSERLGGIWDYRDDPEGIYFADGVNVEKAYNVDVERLKHFDARRKLFGGSDNIQPWRTVTNEQEQETLH